MLTTLGSWRSFLALALVGVLTASLGTSMTRSAEAAGPAPAAIRLDSITSTLLPPDEDLAGVPAGAVPTVLAVADAPLIVTVSFLDSSGLPTSFTKDTRLVVTSNRGTVTAIDTVARRGEETSELIVSIPSPANQVKLTVTVPAGKRSFDTGADGQVFDVVSELRVLDSTPDFQQGIGGDGECAQATRSAPVCGIVVLPRGASSSKVLLSLGPCEILAYTGCGDLRGSVVQTLVGLNGYSRTAPATILVKCDKTLCGGGAIQSTFLNFTRAGNDPLETVDPCPSKGTVGPLPQIACVDYVQSKRDGSGDTFLYLLFVQDARVSVG